MAEASRKGSAARRALARELASAPAEATFEVDGAPIRFSHLDRVYWPPQPDSIESAITKRQLLLYLLDAAPLMLPHLHDRPLTLFRWSEGIDGKRKLVKHWDRALPSFVDRVRIFSQSKGHDDEYLVCNNLATLLWLAQNGVLEIHVWHSRIRDGPDAAGQSEEMSGSQSLEASIIEYPDYLLFDIDPYIYSGAEAPGAEPQPSRPAFAKAKAVALWLRRLLDDLRLESFVKTTGKTGLHIVVPIFRTLAYRTVREIARTIGEHLLREHPDEVTTEWSTEKRSGKVFIDYNMNVRGKSIIAPYCPRGLPGAPVSLPLSWKELESAWPDHFTIATVRPLLARRRDRWAPLDDRKQALEQILGITKQ